MIDLRFPGFASVMDGLEGDVAEAATGAMRATSYKALRELRRETIGAGLGQRLANTWRDRVYPQRRRSMAPTGLIWSRAPEIIDGFSRGATIYPLDGKRFLAIPTDNVPMIRRRIFDDGPKRGGRMTPGEVQHTFNQDLVFRPGRNGTILAFLEVVRARNRRGFRPATAGRLKQARNVEPILMFVLVPSVQLTKAFDLDRSANQWAENYTNEFARRLGAR